MQTANFCYQTLFDEGAFEQYDGFLVACFSDHPLTHILREHLASKRLDKPVLNILEAAVTHALLLGRRFGIITTGKGMVDPIIDATNALLGGKSDRFFVLPTELGVVELRERNSAVRSRMMSVAAVAAERGADVLILGCAGMAGMEEWMKEGARPREVRVVDGVKAYSWSH